jgi:sensor histidine kinase YesM
VAGACILVHSYLNGAWLNMTLGTFMLAAYLVIMSALSRRSRQPVRPKTKTMHRKH